LFSHSDVLLPVFSLISQKIGKEIGKPGSSEENTLEFDASCLGSFSGNLGVVLYEDGEGDRKVVLSLQGNVYGEPMSAENFIEKLAQPSGASAGGNVYVTLLACIVLGIF